MAIDFNGNLSTSKCNHIPFPMCSIYGGTFDIPTGMLALYTKDLKEDKPMKQYDVDYNHAVELANNTYEEDISKAKAKRDSYIAEADKERMKAKAIEEAEEKAMKFKVLYDSYIDAGFSPERADSYIRIQM